MGRIFFGWWVLAGLFLIYAASNGIVIFTLPLFYPELIKEFGWNEAEVTRPATVFFVAAGVLHPFGGALLDRFSARRLMLVSFGTVAVALSFYPFVNSLGQLMGIYIAFGLGFGMGGLVANMLVLTRWFVRYRGIAVGILLIGASLGGAAFPLIVRQTLVGSGWREASILLAVLGGAMMILPLVFLVRNHPRDLGLNPDGAEQQTEPPKVVKRIEAQRSDGPTLLEAIKSPTFYLLAFVTGALWFCIVGMLQHQSIYLGQDLGVDRSVLPLVFSVFFWAGIVGKASFGYLSDHFNTGRVMLISIINLALGFIVLRTLDVGETAMMFAFAMISGVGFSGVFTMVQLMIAESFVGRAYGKILGVFTFVDTMAGALGIQVIGSMRVALGSYSPAFNLMIMICLVAAACVIGLNQFSKRATSRAVESA